MTKTELAAYLSSLASLMESIDKVGPVLRPQWLGVEYERTWEQFKQIVKKEHEDEARKSK